MLVALQRDKVDQRGTARGAVRHRDLVRAQAVDAAAIREEQQVRVRSRRQQVLDPVLLTQLAAAHALAAPGLRAELVDRNGLDVAPVREREHELLVLDEVEVGEISGVGQNGRTALVAVLVLDRSELVFDDCAQLDFVGEDRFELGDRLCELFVLVAQLLALERGQSPQRHVEDVRRLRLTELVRRELQRLTRRIGRLRAADQRDDRVDHVEGF